MERIEFLLSRAVVASLCIEDDDNLSKAEFCGPLEEGICSNMLSPRPFRTKSISAFLVIASFGL